MPLVKPTLRDLPLLVEMLEDPNPVYREDAAKSLVGLGPQGKKAVPALGRLVSTDSVPGIREAAIQALAAMGKEAKGAVEPLALAIKDENTTCRRQAVYALARIDPTSQRAYAAIAEAMVDSDESVRVAAASVIHRMAR